MRTEMTKNTWFLPAFCVALGLAVFTAQAILLGGRSETVRGLRGDGRDERFRMIDIHASAVAGTAVILTLSGARLVELARGEDGNPYGELMAVGGIAYLVAIGFMRWRG
jgi:hypothetical protein